MKMENYRKNTMKYGVRLKESWKEKNWTVTEIFREIFEKQYEILQQQYHHKMQSQNHQIVKQPKKESSAFVCQQ